MKSSNVLAALVTLGLATAAATPAMALENQFSGAFTSFYNMTNYGDVYGQKDPVNDATDENYFVQRVRLGYTAKASEQVKLVTKFELDYTFWGNSSYTTGRNTGGAIGADSVNIETKNLYLELNYPTLNTKIGMLGVTDAFKGTIFDADMSGILLGHEYQNASVAAGFFRWRDSGEASRLGKDVNDMFMLDAKYNVTKNLKIGGAYYYIADNRSNGSSTTPSALPTGQLADGTPIYATTTTFTTTQNPKNDLKVHTLGLNADSTFGPLTVNGFALTQFGDLNATTKAKGYEFNVGAKYNLGAAGTVRSELLYAAGGKNSVYSADGGDEGGGFYDNEMIILGRDKNQTSNDAAIVFNVTNKSQGVIFGSLGYDYTFSDKLSASANLGFAQVAKDLAAHKSKYLGTEVNCETNYKLMPAVTVGARAGYVVLGDYFSAGEDNPYDIKLLAKFSF
jgi:hypothetical protein